MLDQLLLQTVNVAQPDFASQITALIIAIASIVGTIGALLLGILNRMGVFKNKEAVTEVAKGMITFGQKTVEQEEKIKTVADVSYQLSTPEMKAQLDAQNMTLAKLQKDVEAAHAQLARIKPIVIDKTSARADPDTDPNMPR